MCLRARACNEQVFTWQGFIAFVAFIDIATALRNYVERRSFMSGNEEFTDVKLIEGEEDGWLRPIVGSDFDGALIFVNLG